MKTLSGVHHVTAITQNAQRNADFYAGVLGLRLVKKTVNFDDPHSYHLYYGDTTGKPGTLLTFFVWPNAGAGRVGSGEPSKLAFEIPTGSLPWWQARLQAAAVQTKDDGPVFGAATLALQDPDGMQVELVESGQSRDTAIWTGSGVPEDKAIRTISGFTLSRRAGSGSDELYTKQLGFVLLGTDGERKRFAVGEGPSMGFVDVVESGNAGHGRMGAGTIHHVAFRTQDDAGQSEWLKEITRIGLHVSPVMDRKYFHSIYFREPSGVLFEIATDGPGMAVDEPAAQLGESLMLPAEYESARKQIESFLPALHQPQAWSPESAVTGA